MASHASVWGCQFLKHLKEREKTVWWVQSHGTIERGRQAGTFDNNWGWCPQEHLLGRTKFKAPWGQNDRKKKIFLNQKKQVIVKVYTLRVDVPLLLDRITISEGAHARYLKRIFSDTASQAKVSMETYSFKSHVYISVTWCISVLSTVPRRLSTWSTLLGFPECDCKILEEKRWRVVVNWVTAFSIGRGVYVIWRTIQPLDDWTEYTRSDDTESVGCSTQISDKT